jgi:hypothetical protein
MTTTDGITTEDWDRVTELALEVSNQFNSPEYERCRQDLFNYLDRLEVKYGALPSILATRADFTSGDDTGAKEELLVRAYALAIERRDRKNALAIAHSLADLYLDSLRDSVEGGRWLNCFGAQLYEDPDDAWWSKEYERLKQLARALGG